ncbi:ABC transporter ATP-binding protein [Bifidobacterium aquikefiri]|uniref:ABC transporter ATP-binding protein n=1 Tax=Bifidobacterium aquikefiri TaxID=1653207 RepID=UPI0039E838B0
MESQTLAVEISGLSVSFGAESSKPLTDVNLKVPKGQFVCILGPSGQGKSTLLRTIAGLQQTDSGYVRSFGETIRGPSAKIGMVFQGDVIPPWLRVRDNVAFGLRMRGIPESKWGSRVDDLITSVGLSTRVNAWPKELSGGMRKRVAIAAVFANNPRLLLMDEPFSALDYFTRSNLHELLLELWQSTGKTILFVTHDVDEAIKLADRIVVVSHGIVANDIAVEFSRPRNDSLRMNAEADELRTRLLSMLTE